MFTHYLVTHWRGVERIAVDFSNYDDAVDYAKEMVQKEEATQVEIWTRRAHVQLEVVLRDDY